MTTSHTIPVLKNRKMNSSQALRVKKTFDLNQLSFMNEESILSEVLGSVVLKINNYIDLFHNKNVT